MKYLPIMTILLAVSCQPANAQNTDNLNTIVIASSHQCLHAAEFRGYPCDSPIHQGKYDGTAHKYVSRKSSNSSNNYGAVGLLFLLFIAIAIILGVIGGINKSRK